jgi:hypothetical protein
MPRIVVRWRGTIRFKGKNIPKPAELVPFRAARRQMHGEVVAPPGTVNRFRDARTRARLTSMTPPRNSQI